MSVVRFRERPAPLAFDPAVAFLGNEPEGAAFDFVNMRGFIRDRARPANNWLGDPNAKLSYTTPSAKMVAGPDGVLRSGTALRCDYDAALQPRGLRVESQRTNVMLKSEFGSGVTDAGSRGGLISTAPFVGLSGGTGVRLGWDGATVTWGYKSGNAVLNGQSWCFSCFVRMDDGLGPPVVSGANDLAIIIAGNSAPSTVEDYGGGLYRVWATRTVTADGNVSAGVVKYGYYSSRTFVMSGFQFELGTYPTTYLPTTTAQVTRAADSISLLASLFPYNQSSGVLIADYTPTPALSISSAGACLRNLGGSTYSALLQSGSTVAQGITRDAGVSQASLQLAHARSRTRTAMFYKQDDFRMSVDGGAVVADSLGTVPTDVDRLFFGAYGTNINVLDGFLRRVKYLPRASITDGELQALAA